MSYFLWYPFVHWEKLVLEKNGDNSEKNGVSDTVSKLFGKGRKIWLVGYPEIFQGAFCSDETENKSSI